MSPVFLKGNFDIYTNRFKMYKSFDTAIPHLGIHSKKNHELCKDSATKIFNKS